MFEVRHRGNAGDLCMCEDNKRQLAGWTGYEIQRQNRVAAIYLREYGMGCVTQ